MIIELTNEEAQFITALVGKQPTESGAFNLWLKLRKQLESPAPIEAVEQPKTKAK